jgi:hypothetical protein
LLRNVERFLNYKATEDTGSGFFWKVRKSLRPLNTETLKSFETSGTSSSNNSPLTLERSRIAVSRVSGYGMDGREIEVQSPAGAKGFSF